MPTQPDHSDAHTGPSFSLRNRLGRVVWGVACLLLFRPSPRPLHKWRAWLLRRFGATIGRNVHVYPGAKIWALESIHERGDARLILCHGTRKYPSFLFL